MYKETTSQSGIRNDVKNKRMVRRLLDIRFAPLVLSVILSLFFWTADGLIDTIVFREGSFLEVFILAAPTHDIYMRTLVVLLFIFSGITFSWGYTRLKRTRESFKGIRK